MRHVVALAVGLRAAQLLSGCGSDGVEPSPKDFAEQAIVGGAPAKAGMFPGIVSLRRPGGYHGCGGTLIAPHWVITAAHCMDPGFRGGFEDVVAGNLVVSSNTGEHLAIWRAYRHAEFDTTSLANDYTLLRLQGDAKEPAVKLASVSDMSSMLPKAELSVAGWGDTVEGSGEGSDKLLYTTIPLIDHSACAKAVPDVRPETICAGAAEGGKDSCQGDSGGPLFAQIAGKQVQVGVVSSGYGCAQPNTPGLYAGVASASGWIAATMAKGESDIAKYGACVASCDKASVCSDAEDPATCLQRNESCLCTCVGETTGLCDLTVPTVISPGVEDSAEASSTADGVAGDGDDVDGVDGVDTNDGESSDDDEEGGDDDDTTDDGDTTDDDDTTGNDDETGVQDDDDDDETDVDGAFDDFDETEEGPTDDDDSTGGDDFDSAYLRAS